MEMHEYLEILKAQIRCVKVRDSVAKEVEDHIKDQAMAYRQSGMTESEAISEAVRQMGDPVAAGVELDRIHRPAMDWKLVAFAAVLSIIGLLIQYVFGRQQADLTMFYKQCVYTGIGILLMAAVSLVDYSVIGKYGFALWGLLSGFVLLTVLFGPTYNGSHLYIRNYIYLYVPVYTGILYHYRNGGVTALVKCGLFHMAAMILSLMAVTIPACLDVTVICLIMTSIAIWKGWFAVNRKAALAGLWLAAVLLPLILVGIGGINFMPYQIARLEAVLNPAVDPLGRGYIPGVIRDTFQGSTWAGPAVKTLDGRMGSLHTDYILIQLISSYGLLAGTGVVLAAIGFVVHGFHMTVRMKNQLGQMLGIGCCLVFFLQIFHYVMLNLGRGLINTGMPFLSYGKGPVFATSILVGLLMSVYRYKNISTEQKAGHRQRYQLRIEKI